MPQKSSNPPKGRRQPAAPGRARFVTVFSIADDPAALQDMALPAGAHFAIVSTDPAATTELLKASGKTLGQHRLAVVGGARTASVCAESVPVIAAPVFEPDARSQAVRRGLAVAEKDLAESGGAYDRQQVQTLLQGITRQAIARRVQAGSLLAVPGPGKRRRYPTLQFCQDGSVVSGLKEVRHALPTQNPWMVLQFLAHPDDRLNGRRPIDLLKDGNTELVVAAARLMGQPGA